MGEPKAKRAKTPKDPNAPPPPDLDEEMVQQISSYLEERGGSADLGRLTTDIPGLKKTQLEAHFVLAPQGGSPDKILVCLHGFEVTEESVVTESQPKKTKKLRPPKDPNAAPPPPLDDGILQQIREYLEEAGGAAALGKVTSVFPGVKMVQLS